MAIQSVIGGIYSQLINQQTTGQYVAEASVINEQISAGTTISVPAIASNTNQAFSGSPH